MDDRITVHLIKIECWELLVQLITFGLSCALTTKQVVSVRRTIVVSIDLFRAQISRFRTMEFK